MESGQPILLLRREPDDLADLLDQISIKEALLCLGAEGRHRHDAQQQASG